MYEKKGAAHVEMVLAFVFFVTFVSFLFLMLKPYESTVLTESMLDDVQDAFIERVTINYSKVLMEIDISHGNQGQGGSVNCFTAITPEGELSYKGSIVIDLINNEIVESELRANSDREVYVKLRPVVGNRIQIIRSSNFSNENINVNCQNTPDMTAGALFERHMISYESILSLKNQFDADYVGVRDSMNIPQIFDFSIVFDRLPELNMVRVPPGNVDVFVLQDVLEIVNSTGDVTVDVVTFSVW